MEIFAGINFHIFHGCQDYCESFPWIFTFIYNLCIMALFKDLKSKSTVKAFPWKLIRWNLWKFVPTIISTLMLCTFRSLLIQKWPSKNFIKITSYSFCKNTWDLLLCLLILYSNLQQVIVGLNSIFLLIILTFKKVSLSSDSDQNS